MTRIEQTFWMVWNQNGKAPTYRHESEEAATHEAERLARMNSGQIFVVLCSITARQVNDMQVIDYEGQIPF